MFESANLAFILNRKQLQFLFLNLSQHLMYCFIQLPKKLSSKYADQIVLKKGKVPFT